ncbi:MAG: hypothetical protein ABH821_06085 [archaeon]
MFKKNQKGQSALEYLMTYGWALVVIVIVVVALYALGILDPASYTASTCRGFSGLAYKTHIANTTDGFEIVVTNSTGGEITLTGAQFDGQVLGLPTETTIAAQGEADIGPTAVTGLSAGASYSKIVTITYNVSGLQTPKTETATCTGTA